MLLLIFMQAGCSPQDVSQSMYYTDH
uniref:Uncharacterized protein n=1 Tax=Anguilla anguilla TaxID=7936 RepID=A0A0E9VI54_ANGAN